MRRERCVQKTKMRREREHEKEEEEEEEEEEEVLARDEERAQSSELIRPSIFWVPIIASIDWIW
jgi:hypothetical protein